MQLEDDEGIVEWLVACEEIRQLKARYFRAVDTKEWVLLTEVFAPDAISGPNEGGVVTEGLEASLNASARRWDECRRCIKAIARKSD
jgi:hypothetical protein